MSLIAVTDDGCITLDFRMTQALLAEATGSTRNTNSPTGCNKTISMQQLRLQPVMKVKLIPSINGHTV